MISGIPASPGVVFGKALVLKEEKIVLDTTKLLMTKLTLKLRVFMKAVVRLLSS
ncbi:phosphoenolpyruvate-protein phosphotransferase [Rodentibacter pneumotropicus]|uniref:Phosphoenolpyruvate-protein phosphotransferase n=1 Tax=Rodentibacter pneumotropicus TaxID=758 RepID=A0A448MRE1_9PAST|nr:phosphoenolpyruvate-protein phosphotransferase [Rodentibacter pneumotropicus]